MGAYDTLTAGLSGAGLALVSIVTVHGTSDYHLNAAQMQAQIQDAASAALLESGQNWAQVEMRGQQAFITGAPPNVEAAETAKAAVLTSSGPGGPVWGGVWSVTTEFAEIRDIPTASPFVWRAIKNPSGAMILVGAVPDQASRIQLSEYAAELSGVSVDDRSQLSYGVPDGDWVGMARLGLDQLALIDSGEARLTDHDLHLRGIAMDDLIRIKVTATVSNVSDPWSGVAEIDGPSHWKAEHVDGALILSGACETAEERAEIAQIADTYFDGPVIDQMQVATSDHESWIQGVRLGLPHFTRFESGQMEFEPTGDGFSFDGEASPSTLQYLREDMAQLEGDYAVEIAVEPISVELTELTGVALGNTPMQVCQTSFDVVMESNSVVFESGSAEISRDSGVTLDKIMTVYQSCDETLKIEVAGHTDDTGDREANIVLSRARAQAVSNYMRDAGFDVSRLIVEGYGPERPRADNATPDGRTANRRIEFYVQERSE